MVGGIVCVTCVLVLADECCQRGDSRVIEDFPHTKPGSVVGPQFRRESGGLQRGSACREEVGVCADAVATDAEDVGHRVGDPLLGCRTDFSRNGRRRCGRRR